MTLQNVLPMAGMPRTGAPENGTRSWYGLDSLELYQASDDKYCNEAAITYKFNSHGYRGPNFDKDAAIRIVSVGDGYTFGLGVSEEQLFHERVARQLEVDLNTSVVNWNLGKAEGSNDYLARTLFFALRELDPHIVLVQFSDIRKREAITAENHSFTYRPDSPLYEDAFKELANSFSLQANPLQDQLNFFRAYCSVQSSLSDRLWFYSISDAEQIPRVAVHLDVSSQVKTPPAVDRGRDGSHPGPETHGLMFDAFWQRLVESNSLKLLPRFRQTRRVPPRIASKTPVEVHEIGPQWFAPLYQKKELSSAQLIEDAAQGLLSVTNRDALTFFKRANGDADPYNKYLDIDLWIRKNLKRAVNLGLHLSPPLRILDIGSGPGYFMLACRYFGHAVSGLDLDKKSLFAALMRQFRLRSFVHQIEPLQMLPDLGQKFDLITAFAVCFNAQSSPHPWGIPEWDFFLRDIARHASEEASLYLELNRESDGKFYDDDLKEYFLQRGEVNDNRIRITLRHEHNRDVGAIESALADGARSKTSFQLRVEAKTSIPKSDSFCR